MRYTVISALPILLLVVGVTCVVISLVKWRALLIVSVICVVLLAWMYLHPTYMRTARWDGSAPTTRDVSNIQAPVYVVGAGWSSYLQHSSPTGDIMFTHNMRGEYTPNVWGAGTTIEEVQTTLCKRGLTLSGHPSITSATLGGWIFSGSHGSGGSLWKPCIDQVTVWDQMARRKLVGKPQNFFSDFKTDAEQRKYIILDVRVTPVPNVWCRRIVFLIENPSDARQFLCRPSYLRLIFVNSHGATCLLWTPEQSERPRSSLSKKPAYLLGLPAALPLPSPESKFWNTRQTLGDANAFSPDPPAMGNVIALTVTNFEFFVYIELTETLLYKICTAHQKLFESTTQGRVDIRYGHSKLFLDYAIFGSHIPIVRLLHNLFDKTIRIVLHKGKAQVKF